MAVEPVMSIEHHTYQRIFGVDHLNLSFDDDVLHHLEVENLDEYTFKSPTMIQRTTYHFLKDLPGVYLLAHCWAVAYDI